MPPKTRRTLRSGKVIGQEETHTEDDETENNTIDASQQNESEQDGSDSEESESIKKPSKYNLRRNKVAQPDKPKPVATKKNKTKDVSQQEEESEQDGSESEEPESIKKTSKYNLRKKKVAQPDKIDPVTTKYTLRNRQKDGASKTPAPTKKEKTTKPKVNLPENPKVTIKFGDVNLGLVHCPKDNGLRPKDKFTFINNTDQEKILSNWKEKCYKNIDKVEKILDFCYIKQIKLYEIPYYLLPKLSSKMFYDKFSEEQYEWIIKLGDLKIKLFNIGKKAYLYGIRLVIKTDLDCQLGNVSPLYDELSRSQVTWMDNMFNIFIEGATAVTDEDKKSMNVQETVEGWSQNLLIINRVVQHYESDASKKIIQERFLGCLKKLPVTALSKLALETEKDYWHLEDLAKFCCKNEIPCVINFIDQYWHAVENGKVDKKKIKGPGKWIYEIDSDGDEIMLPNEEYSKKSPKIFPDFYYGSYIDDVCKSFGNKKPLFVTTGYNTTYNKPGKITKSISKLPEILDDLQDQTKNFDVIIDCTDKEEAISKLTDSNTKRYEKKYKINQNFFDQIENKEETSAQKAEKKSKANVSKPFQTKYRLRAYNNLEKSADMDEEDDSGNNTPVEKKKRKFFRQDSGIYNKKGIFRKQYKEKLCLYGDTKLKNFFYEESDDDIDWFKKRILVTDSATGVVKEKALSKNQVE